MVRAKKKETQILSQGELKDLKQEKHELETSLGQLQEYGAGTAAEGIDKQKIKQEINRLDNAIQSGSPRRISGSEKDRVANEARALEERIKEGMPTIDEMRKPQNHPGCIRKNAEWERRNKGDIMRWKQLQRQLEPHDPTSSNIERLRRA